MSIMEIYYINKYNPVVNDLDNYCEQNCITNCKKYKWHKYNEKYVDMLDLLDIQSSDFNNDCFFSKYGFVYTFQGEPLFRLEEDWNDFYKCEEMHSNYIKYLKKHIRDIIDCKNMLKEDEYLICYAFFEKNKSLKNIKIHITNYSSVELEEELLNSNFEAFEVGTIPIKYINCTYTLSYLLNNYFDNKITIESVIQDSNIWSAIAEYEKNITLQYFMLFKNNIECKFSNNEYLLNTDISDKERPKRIKDDINNKPTKKAHIYVKDKLLKKSVLNFYKAINTKATVLKEIKNKETVYKTEVIDGVCYLGLQANNEDINIINNIEKKTGSYVYYLIKEECKDYIMYFLLLMSPYIEDRNYIMNMTKNSFNKYYLPAYIYCNDKKIDGIEEIVVTYSDNAFIRIED